MNRICLEIPQLQAVPLIDAMNDLALQLSVPAKHISLPRSISNSMLQAIALHHRKQMSDRAEIA